MAKWREIAMDGAAWGATREGTQSCSVSRHHTYAADLASTWPSATGDATAVGSTIIALILHGGDRLIGRSDQNHEPLVVGVRRLPETVLRIRNAEIGAEGRAASQCGQRGFGGVSGGREDPDDRRALRSSWNTAGSAAEELWPASIGMIRNFGF